MPGVIAMDPMSMQALVDAVDLYSLFSDVIVIDNGTGGPSIFVLGPYIGFEKLFEAQFVVANTSGAQFFSSARQWMALGRLIRVLGFGEGLFDVNITKHAVQHEATQTIWTVWGIAEQLGWKSSRTLQNKIGWFKKSLHIATKTWPIHRNGV